jgi:hypothetical protein
LLRPGGRPQTGASAHLDASLAMAVPRSSVTSQISRWPLGGCRFFKWVEKNKKGIFPGRDVTSGPRNRVENL